MSGNVDEVLRSEDQIEVRAQDMPQLQNIIQQMSGISKAQLTNNGLLLSCDTSVQPYHVNEYCMKHGIVLSHLLLKKKSLETKFMELTN